MPSYKVTIERRLLDLRLCLNSGQVFRWHTPAPDVWLGVDGPHWYELRQTDAYIEAHSNADEHEFRRLFRLDVDLEAVEAEIRRKAPELGPYIHAVRGLRLMRPGDPAETLLCFLCTPNNHLARIKGMVASLASFGERLHEDLRAFPTLERVAAIPESELRARGFGYRGSSIPRAAAMISELGGARWLPGLKSGSYDDAFNQLMRLPGVGPKLADCIALFALDKTEAAPVDTHLWQAAVRLYFPEWRDKALTLARYEAIGNLFRSKFGDLAGFAHQYLFYENLLRGGRRRASVPPAGL